MAEGGVEVRRARELSRLDAVREVVGVCVREEEPDGAGLEG